MQLNAQTRPFSGIRRNATALAAALATSLALILTTSGCATSAHTHSMSDASGMDKAKVIFQVSDPSPKTWNLALNNLKNVQKSLGKDKVDAELVVYGPGIGMLKLESTAGNRVNAAVADGIKVVACENTMKKLKLTKADMLASISYVPGGVIELMEKQKEGYAYIRP